MGERREERERKRVKKEKLNFLAPFPLASGSRRRRDRCTLPASDPRNQQDYRNVDAQLFPPLSSAPSLPSPPIPPISGSSHRRTEMSTGSPIAGQGDADASTSAKNQFSGVLFKYGPKPMQVAFKSGEYNQQVIFLSGMKEGFLSTEYLEPLAVALDKEGWSLVQVLLSSSYSGYGNSTLRQDAMELDDLICHLIEKEDSAGVVLLGHGTGCQDIVHYMQATVKCSRAVRAVILQAPVSDRERIATIPETAKFLELASTMIREGKGSDLMPREADPTAPITASWYHSLCSYMGEYDMFSSDLTDEQLRTRLGHMSDTHCQVIYSLADECVPPHVDKRALFKRLCKAMGGAERAEIRHGNHSLSNRVEEAVETIIDFIRREGPTGWDDPWN